MYWSEEVSSIITKLHSDPKEGLSEAEVEEALREHGENVLTQEKKHGQLRLFFKQFKNTMTYMLLLATAVSFFLNERIDAFAIFAIVLMNGLVGYIQEAKAEASIEALRSLSQPKAKVIRDGTLMVIDSKDVVPGDLLTLESGDYIVGDAVIVEAFQLSAYEAVLTGESMPVEKERGVLTPEAELAEHWNVLHAGTAVTTGSARAIVVNTGMKTEIGKIAGLLNKTESEETPLQKRLAIVSNKLLIIGGVVMLIVAGIGISRDFDWLSIFMYSISLAVAAIPEGLPSIVTLALALAVRRMSKRNAIVRKMASVESLGSTDIICTDKTGTLTTGDMVVRDIFTLTSEAESELLQAAVDCNNASLNNGGTGDPTEVALLLMAKNRRPDPRLHEWSFDSKRKRMSVAVESSEGVKIYTKGAPEETIARCRLTAEEKQRISEVVSNFAGQGRRTLALAFRNYEGGSTFPEAEEVERELTFLGLVAMADPPKEETVPAIRACRSSGIKVIMITGDHPLTAEAIAKELGIIDPGSESAVMTGAEIDKIEPEELREISQKISVYARVSPEHKLRIVEALQANGHTVAMTGDGVNDAPALKKASIGVAMGKAGTEVARQASSMILTDDNFATIVSAVEEGRAIFGNIKRTIQYLLSTNLAEILIVLGSLLIGMPMPFVPIALLWINLVTDGFPALALAAEPVEKDFLQKNREPSPKSFFNRGFMREMLIVAVIMTVIELAVYGYMLNRVDEHIAKSYAFNLLVYLCLFRSFSCRSDSRTYFQMKLNPYHLIAVAIPILLQIGLENVEMFQKLFDISPISFMEHAILILFSLIPVSFIELKKMLGQR